MLGSHSIIAPEQNLKMCRTRRYSNPVPVCTSDRMHRPRLFFRGRSRCWWRYNPAQNSEETVARTYSKLEAETKQCEWQSWWAEQNGQPVRGVIERGGLYDSDGVCCGLRAPRTCLACSHPNRAAIDGAIATGEPLRDISTYVSISPSALARHKTHVSVALARLPRSARSPLGVGIIARLASGAKGFWMRLGGASVRGRVRCSRPSGCRQLRPPPQIHARREAPVTSPTPQAAPRVVSLRVDHDLAARCEPLAFSE